MSRVMVTMKQGGVWTEIQIPHYDMIGNQLHWLKEHIRPHAIKFPGGIWDELNGWREKTLTSEYYHKFVKKTPKIDFNYLRRQLEKSLYGQQQHIFQHWMENDKWSNIQQNIIKQREAAQWGTIGLMRPSLNQLGAFLYSPEA